MTSTDEARAALLEHFARVGRFAPGGKHANEHVRLTDALIAAIRAEAVRFGVAALHDANVAHRAEAGGLDGESVDPFNIENRGGTR